MKDNFSRQASGYARYRPTYPEELFDFIASLAPGKGTAWDCATGNGQVAAFLAKHFEKVYATDISEKQLARATAVKNILYSRQPAEKTVFPDKSFDLITVAQAIHWFDFGAFYQEVDRVLKPGGTLAVIGYGLLSLDHSGADKLVRDFYLSKIGSYWDPERRYVDNHYRDIPFPFKEIPHPTFSIGRHWNLDQLTGYLGTWSAVQHFISRNGYNPVDALKQELQKVWPEEESVEVHFPLFMKVGRK